MDDLRVIPIAEKTLQGTLTAVRSFNRFWATHIFNPSTEQELFNVRAKYLACIDGFHTLCVADHSERNVMLCHYVAKFKPCANKKTKVAFLQGGSKRIYLLSIQRALKFYEKQNKLVDVYGRDWCFSNSVEYEQLESALDNTTCDNEFGNPQKEPVAIMIKTQFEALHARTWELANDTTLPVSERLKHKLRYFMQGTVAFGCLRAREDLADCRTDEFTMVSSDCLEFQMKRKFKSHRLTSSKKVIHKPARYIYGDRYVQIFQEMMMHQPQFDAAPAKTSCKSLKKPPALKKKNSKLPGFQKKINTLLEMRLFLHVLPGCVPSDFVYFKKEPMGEQTVAQAVTAYIPMLRAENSLFQDNNRYTNSSLRKYHNDALSEAGAPLIVQQESLAQNTKAYARKATDPSNKLKVAKIVSGERQTWHSPVKLPATELTSNPLILPTSNPSIPLKKRKVENFFEEHNKENNQLSFTTTDNCFKLLFKNEHSSFQFEGKL